MGSRESPGAGGLGHVRVSNNDKRPPPPPPVVVLDAERGSKFHVDTRHPNSDPG